MIRTAAILQLLLGNIGRPGRRDHGDARPRLDTGLDRHPDAVRPAPRLPEHAPGARGHPDPQGYVDTGGADRGWWSFFETYTVSLLKAWFGDAAKQENGYGFGWLPKLTSNHSHYSTMLRALDGGARGALCDGTEPRGRLQARGAAASGPRQDEVGRRTRVAEIETATFWRDSPEVSSGELRPRTSRPRCS